MRVSRLLAFTAVLLSVSVNAFDWSSVDTVLNAHNKAGVYPGAVAAVAQAGEVLYMKAVGSLTYGNAPPQGPNAPVTSDTLYDLASLTKVTTTTSAVAMFYQRGELDIDMPLMDPSLLGPAYGNNGKDTITSRRCLEHNAGYPPDPVPDYWAPSFGCPNTPEDHPAEDFSCVQRAYDGLMQQTLINPVGAKYVYSDLSMITMQYVVGGLALDLGYVSSKDFLPACAKVASSDGLSRSCAYEAYVRKFVFGANNMTDTGFLPAQSEWSRTAPAWDDTVYRHEIVQGQVSDGNSYALGGVAGHAGVFSTVPDIMKLMKRIMFAPAAPSDGFLNATTVKTFTTVQNVTQSSRALGWDTNNYQSNSYRGCGNFSSLTYTHTGYTGTQVCNDPTRDVITILFTNRVYPDKTAQAATIHVARQDFNNAVLAVLSKQ